VLSLASPASTSALSALLPASLPSWVLASTESTAAVFWVALFPCSVRRRPRTGLLSSRLCWASAFACVHNACCLVIVCHAQSRSCYVCAPSGFAHAASSFSISSTAISFLSRVHIMTSF
jgi:hypothetical protein